jgi:hypothetical protein
MKHAENDYISAGYKFERASTQAARAISEKIRAMLDAETIDDQTEARRLIERGREEARRN